MKENRDSILCKLLSLTLGEEVHVSYVKIFETDELGIFKKKHSFQTKPFNKKFKVAKIALL